MRLSENGCRVIKSHGDLAREAYADDCGILRIGWGHTPAHEGQTCTEQDAEWWFRSDAQIAEGYVLRGLRVPVNQNQFDALVSLVYSGGGRHFAESEVLNLVNGLAWNRAADAILKWDTDANPTRRLVPATIKERRLRERNLFLTPIE
jgi:lysozyme